MIRAAAASSGIGIGRAVIWASPERFAPRRRVSDANLELRKLYGAIDACCAQLEKASALAAKNFGQPESAIITAQIILLNDFDLLRDIETGIRKNMENAERAVAQVFDGYIQTFSNMEDALMRARDADFRDIKNRVLSILAGDEEPDFKHLAPESIIVAREMPASTLACLPVRNISGIVTHIGSVHSHAAILARARRIPFVVNAGNLDKIISEGDEMIADGGTGEIIVRPTSEEISRYRERQRQQNLVRERMDVHKDRKIFTRDGKQVELSATISVLSELPEAVYKGIDAAVMPAAHAHGVNIMGERQQFLAYKAITRALNGKPVVVAVEEIKINRQTTPYFGGALPSLQDNRESSRLIANEPRLRASLNALLRASAFGKVRVVIPKVISVTELRLARDLLKSCKTLLLEQQADFDPEIGLGALIETPAAALCANVIAREADFLVLGTNNLINQTLAIEKAVKKNPERQGVFHPAVLQLIYQTVQAADSARIPIMVIGEMASDPMMIPFLVGCGVQGIGVKPGSLLNAREQCENLKHLYWQKRVPEILSLDSPEEVVGYFKQNWAERPQGNW